MIQEECAAALERMKKMNSNATNP